MTLVVIGQDRVKTEGNVTIIYKDGTTRLCVSEGIKSIFINPQCVSTIIVDEKKNTI